MKHILGCIIIGLSLLGAAVILRPSGGRFAMIQRENNRMVLLDTKTGQFWDVPPARVGSRPVLEDSPKLELQ